MPIKPENRGRYPKDWKTIRGQILERAGHRCEWDGCGVANHAIGYWVDGTFRQISIKGDLASLDWAAAESVWHGDKVIEIVLTIAHLDHQPENCDPANLRAWCQRHHLAYDHQHHQANARATRRGRKAIGDLFASEQS